MCGRNTNGLVNKDKKSLLEDPRKHGNTARLLAPLHWRIQLPTALQQANIEHHGKGSPLLILVSVSWLLNKDWNKTLVWLFWIEYLLWLTSSGILVLRPLPSSYPTYRNHFSPSCQHPTNKINTHPTFTYSIAWPVLLKYCITANWTGAYSYPMICWWSENDVLIFPKCSCGSLMEEQWFAISRNGVVFFVHYHHGNALECHEYQAL